MKISFIVIANLAILLNVFKVLQIVFDKLNEKVILVYLSNIKNKQQFNLLLNLKKKYFDSIKFNKYLLYKSLIHQNLNFGKIEASHTRYIIRKCGFYPFALICKNKSCERFIYEMFEVKEGLENDKEMIELIENNHSFQLSNIINGFNQFLFLDNLRTNSEYLTEYFKSLDNSLSGLKDLLIVYFNFFKYQYDLSFNKNMKVKFNRFFYKEMNIKIRSKYLKEILICLLKKVNIPKLILLSRILGFNNGEIHHLYHSKNIEKILLDYEKRFMIILSDLERFVYGLEMKKAKLKKTKLKIIFFLLVLQVILNFIFLRKMKCNNSTRVNIRQLLIKEKLV